MNKRQSKKLRAQAVDLAVQWLKNVVPPDQAELVNSKSILEFEKGQESHVYANSMCRVSAYSTRYFYKILKRAFYRGPDNSMFLINKEALG
jgi:hypothetical protein